MLALIIELNQKIDSEFNMSPEWRIMTYDDLKENNIRFSNHDFKCAMQYLKRKHDK